MDLSFLKVLLPMLITGFKVTLEISIFGILFGFILGGISGFALQCKNKAAKTIANVYIWIIRSTPLIVQALYVYFVVPKLIKQFIEIDITSNVAGIIVISLNSGAFIAEIVRGALEGIDPGQKEAGLSLGLTPFQTLWHVVVPPAFRSMIPPLFNQFIITVKDTAILSVIVVNEITKQIQNYAAVSFNTIQAYTAGAVFYMVIISVLILIQKQVERRIKA
jgi:glutamine transport system permease protein